MPPPTLSYAKRDAPTVSGRTVAALLVAGTGVCVLATLWLRLGIAYGRRVERQEMLFAPATGTTFWDAWVIEAPMCLLLVGLAGLGVLVLVQVARRRWPGEMLCLLPLYLALLFVTFLANAVLIDSVSP